MSKPRSWSETVRGGEPTSHVEAVRNVITFLYKNGFLCRREYPLKVGRFYRHAYDIAAFIRNGETEAIFAMPGFGDNEKLIKFKNKEYIDLNMVIICEVGDIGDDSKHNPGHKAQMLADGVAKEKAEKAFPNALFVRINKDETEIEEWVSYKLGFSDKPRF